MRRWLSGLAACFGLAASGCTPSEYMGISLSAPPSPSEQTILATGQQFLPMTGAHCVDRASQLPIACLLQPASTLAREAVFGNRHAQLELGKRFENGKGVERNFEKAAKLYKRAAKTTGGPMSTCIWDEHAKTCHFTTYELPYNYGLPEAHKRLEALQARLAPPDSE